MKKPLKLTHKQKHSTIDCKLAGEAQMHTHTHSHCIIKLVAYTLNNYTSTRKAMLTQSKISMFI